jgi:putative DNA primase/helicase
MILALSHAFSGPLLSVLGRDGGGFHLRGVSSCGKSTLLGLAASVWGAPSFVQSWRGTDNGIEGIAAACSDSLLVLDELHQMDPRVAREIVYMLANGRGKLRMNSNSKAKRTRRWTVPMLSSGEISLEEHMASGGRTMYAGQDVRLIDLAADARAYGVFDCLHGEPDGRVFAERMQREAAENYGLAGPVFVEKLMAIVERRDLFQRTIDRFCRSCMTAADIPSDGQMQRVLARFGIAATAGEIATKFGLTGWLSGTAITAARELFLGWLDARDGATHEEITVAVERTRNYVSQNLERFFVLGTSGGDPLDGWRDDSWVYIRPECWKIIHADEDPVEIARLHQAAGMLKTPKGGGLQFRMARRIPDRPRVYAVRVSVLIGAASD